MITLNDTHTHYEITLDEGLVRHRHFYVTTHNIHNRQPAMRMVGFEPAILANKRPQTYTSGRVATSADI